MQPRFEKKQQAEIKKGMRSPKVKPLSIDDLNTLGLNSIQTQTRTEKMAFMISRAESETEKSSLNHVEDKDSATVGAISRQLHLKSSSSKASSQTLNKQVVLQRIRHRKSINRIKTAFEGLLCGSEGSTTSTQEQKWLQQDDAFSSP
ncbi:hypothetical protein VNO77_40788 [Canavalia gladiata]|uniref:Uncharacterized protein n=1 Tax=Canavalia gladiata TaxID=3824 RepID=A0AAN9K0B1_CANGL